MYQNTVHALSIAHTASPTRTESPVRGEKEQSYKNKLRKANRGSLLFLAPPPPDEKTVERLNELASRAPFCTYHKHKKGDLL